MSALRLTERVYLVGGGAYGLSDSGDCNIYLIDGGDALALIDAGGGGDVKRVLRNIREVGLNPGDIELLILTHCHFDHIGGAGGIKRETGCSVAAHEAEAGEIERLGPLTLYEMAKARGLEFEGVEVDVRLRGGEKLEVGEVEVEVVHTPGHTPGGVSLLLREGDTLDLFTGDTASAQGRLGWINGPGCNLEEWKRSIKRMVELQPDRLFPGHGVFVLSGALDHLRLLDEKMNAPWINIVTTADFR
ncbi:MBL fold metallo-hydrolase [Candidatus Bathyarchaeota archaeon]|nr:MAG: MBL fold metallo-hydrolase [Candidatus Bathyarchaeota archaeon]